MEVVNLRSEEIPLAGEILADAFIDDGLSGHMYSDIEERRSQLPWHFSAFIRYGVLFGQVLATAGELRGVAVWLPPGMTAITENRAAAAGLDALPAVLGEKGFTRFVEAMDYIGQFHEQDVPEDHWYLALIGVRPEYQGKGVGGALIRPVLAEADRDGLPCYLETAEAGNVGYYEQLGFETRRHGGVAGTAVEYWTMIRPPHRS